MDLIPTDTVILEVADWADRLHRLADRAEVQLAAAARRRNPALSRQVMVWPRIVGRVRWETLAWQAQVLDDTTYVLGDHTLVASLGMTQPPAMPEPPLPAIDRSTKPGRLAHELLAWPRELLRWHDELTENADLAMSIAVAMLTYDQAILDGFARLVVSADRAKSRAGELRRRGQKMA